jgi:GNAT superfamily N-acetyltransferase
MPAVVATNVTPTTINASCLDAVRLVPLPMANQARSQRSQSRASSPRHPQGPARLRARESGQSGTVTVDFRRSSEFSLAELASVFTAAYHGYFVPLVVDEAQLTYMVEVFDLDLSRSLVAVERERPVGLANLGLRGERTWLGGVGVIPDRRGSGIGESLTRMLVDQAREAGAREMALEVIVENAPAIALYEKLGFTRTRVLEVLSLAAATKRSDVRETDVGEALSVVAAARSGPEPWQRADETIANLARRGSTPQAITLDGAAAIFSQDGDRVSLLKAAGDTPGLGALVAALQARGSVAALNFPATEPLATALREAGATVRLSQYEMILPL